jgi:endonuclease YncB( thermonuclease family)
MFEYAATVKRVKDGDTLVMDIDLGFFVHIEEIVRLAHVDTPETINFDAGGLNDPAKSYIMACVPPGAGCVVRISRKEKYGRWLAVILFRPGVSDRVEILRDPRILNEELVDRGFAKAYEGGKK